MNLLKLFVAVVSATVMFTGVATAEMKKVRIGTEGAYPPFNSYDADKNLVGFDIDIAKAICEKMKADCTFVAQDWDGIIPALLANKYDAIIASMSITAEREKKVAFTNKYYNTPARFVAQKGSGITDTSPDALKGKVIGAQSSTTHSSYLEDIYKGAEIKLYGTQDEANLDLASGRTDLVLADSIVLLEWMKTKDGACCEYVGKDVTSEKHFGKGAGIALRKEDTELKAAMNKALAEIVADGTYEKINKKYFPFSIY